MAIGVSKPVGLEVAANAGIGETEISALLTTLIIPFAFCNGFGRPLFGTRDYARNYGLVFTAYGAGAVIGNVLAGQAKDMFGAHIMVFPYVLVLALLGLVVATMLKPPKQE
jgi:MFS family permease